MAETHALLLTDVVDSTRLTERLGDHAMAELWASHNRLARDLLALWRGREIDKADGMLLLFDTVADAVGFALAYHRTLKARGLPILARAGIHWGPVNLRPNPPADVARGAKPLEVDGLALPVVARVMSVALGGQTLLSADAQAALGPVAQRVVSHGCWQLQGIADPVAVFEIGETGAPFVAPGDGAKAYRVHRQGELWLPVRELRHTLPAERDGFVGRQDALQALADRFDAGARLVSVLGMGGTGKTRLANRFAWTRLGDYPGGVWFCDLSQARHAAGIHLAVAQGLELTLVRGDPVAQLAHALAGRQRCLVILDNFEQVAAHAEATLGRWLDRARAAHFIVTTREVLGIPGEATLALDPLPAADAATLFVKRAQAVRLGYTPDADDQAAIQRLVQVLDGLPLAIELAAARLRAMTAPTLLARLHDRLDSLVAGSGRIDRQATLRATFDWSWQLLTDAEKAALARLSVFAGGFTLEAATPVLQAPGANGAASAEALLLSLVDKSLVRQVGGDRHALLESVRDYAAQHLRTEGHFAGSGPACEADTRARHWQFFAALDERAAVAERCVEVHNLVAACREAAAAGDARAATGSLVAAWAALRRTGPMRTALDLVQLVEALQVLDDADHSLVHWVAGSALDLMGDAEVARQRLQAGLQLARHAGATTTTARLLVALGSRQAQDGDLGDALASLREAGRLASLVSHPELLALALNAVAGVKCEQTRFDEARVDYEQALALARELGDRRLEGGVLGNLGGLHHDRGELDLARSLYEQALALAQDVGDQRWEGNAHCNLGLLMLEQGSGEPARAQFEQALAMARQSGHVRLSYFVQCNLGLLLAGEGRLPEARQHLEQAVAGAVAASDRRAEGQFRGPLGLVLARQGHLAAAQASLDLGEQRLQALDDRLSLALLWCDRTEVETLAGRPHAALRAMDAAGSAAQALGCGEDSPLRRRLAALAGVPSRS
jgi:predicted ATPase/class 3 adenylate cyclase/Tfp pilus assembly protein PilF